MATQKIQPDISEAVALFTQQLEREAQRYQVPILGEDDKFTGQFYDVRLGQREDQPQPTRLLEHLQVLQRQGRGIRAGQPIPEFQATDPFESEGFFDSISNVFKLATEKSLTGAAFEAATGEKLVDIEGFQPSKLEEISAEVLSFLSPLDLVALIGGGGVGGLAVKTIAKKAIQKGIAKGLTRKAAEKAAGKSLLQIVPRTAGSIGLHTAASQTLQEKLETGEMSLETFMDGLAKGGLLGAVVGATGGTAGLLTANLSKTAQFGIKLTAEVVALGGASPFIFEDRAPTFADFEHAAEFLVGLRLAGGVAKGAGAAYRRLKGTNRVEAEKQVNDEIKWLGRQRRDFEFNESVTNRLMVAAGQKPITRPKIITGEAKLGELIAPRPTVQEVGKRANDLKVLLNTGEITQKQFEQLSRLERKRLELFRKSFERGRVKREPTPKAPPKLLAPGTGRGTKFGKGFVVTPSKEKFLKRVGSQVVQRRLEQGEAVEMSLEQARKTFGEEPLRGKKPAEVILVQAENGGKALLHRVSIAKKGARKAALNILSFDNIEAFEKAVRVAAEKGLPLSVSTELSGSALFRTLQKRGLIEAPKEGLKFLKVNTPIAENVTREFFQRQMARAVPKAPKGQVEANMAIADALAAAQGESTALYLTKRYLGDVIRSKEKPENALAVAQVQFYKDGRALITAFKGADGVAVLEEMVHVARRDLKGKDLTTAENFSGVKKGKWTVKAEEKFAKGFLRYLQEGKAPTKELRTVFEKFKQWITAVWNKLKGADQIEITPQIKRVFGRLLGEKPVIKPSPPAVRAKELPKILFQERFIAGKLGKTFVDRLKKTLEAIPIQWMKRIKKQATESEAKQLIDMAEDATFRHHSGTAAFEEALASFGLPKIKTEAGRIRLAEDIVAGKRPEYNQLLAEGFKRYKKAGGEAGEITPENAGEHYFRRQLKDDIHVKLYEELDLLKRDLAGVETVTEKAIASALLKRAPILQGGINHILKKGNIKSLQDALKKSERDLGQRFTTDQTWERERTPGLEWPDKFYEKDAGTILPKYFDSLAKKTAELEVFGVGDKKGLELLSKLEVKNFEEYKVMRKALAQWSGAYDQIHGLKGKLRNAADIHAAFQVGTKIALGFAPLLNTTQWIISFMPRVGFWRSLEAGVRLFDPNYRKALRATGILRNSDMQALAMVLGRESIGHFGKIDLGRISQFLSKWSGFTGINRLNNYWAASAIDSIIPKWLAQARGAGRAATIAQKSLKDIGIDWKKPLSEKVRSRAIFDFATKSQLQRNVFEEPSFLNEPALRPFVLFKRFGLRQAGYIMDMMRTEIKRGNYMPLLRFSLAGYAGGTALIWAMNTAKSLLSGEEQFRRNDSFFETALQNFGTLGAFGFIGDLADFDRLSQLGPKVKFFVTPVIFSDVEQFYEGFTRFTKDWERYGDGWLATERNAHSVFNIFGSLPRAAGKQLLTPIQKQRRQANLKGKERTEVLNLLLDGKGSAAADRVANWNKANPEKPIRMSDVSLSAIRKYLERLAETKAGAFGEKGTREFKKAFRKEKKEIRKRVRKVLTDKELAEMRRKLFLLKKKFNQRF